MPVINLLSQNTIDKIAAGEVVERPLSVVKELVENAIDAGASALTVEIKDGGISLVRVTDNGCGIEKGQVKKAFLRHATSKITSIEDLTHVGSLGFRGEALSSIAAVAQVEVVTKTANDLTGVRYSISGGNEEGVEEVGAPAGTTFLVRNLFFNTPVRKKFLKQPQTEGGYVADMMEHLSLSRPDISIKYIQNGQLRFHTSGNGDLREVIYRIYGRDITDALAPFTYNKEGLCMNGFLGKPKINRSNRNFENYFVNGRYVKNDILTKAVEEGYRPYLMQHKFPFFVMHFTLPGEMIDVNVHPAKREIRLKDGNILYDEISGAVRERLHELELIPDVRLTKEDEGALLPAGKVPEPFEVRRAAMLREDDEVYMTPKALKKISEGPQPQAAFMGNKVIGGGNAGPSSDDEGRTNLIKAGEHILVERPTQMDLFDKRFLNLEARENYRILGQIFDTYWLVAFEDKLFIIDQHAAHEKVKYERLVKELESKEVSSQVLSPPVIVSLTGKEQALFKEYLPFFNQLGFEVEDFGGGSIALRGMPLDLYGCNEKEFFADILDELSQGQVKGAPEAILGKLASMACKAAVKGNNKMDRREAEALLDEFLALDDPYHCPHGRPTIISMSKYEIEKSFKRII